MVTEGVPAFILAYSRTCNFDTNGQIIEHPDGSAKVLYDVKHVVILLPIPL